MNISIFDLFNIGIGPSSSHCIGPMRAAKTFVTSITSPRTSPLAANAALPPFTKGGEDTQCPAGDVLGDVRITIDLYGSLAFTGEGHGTNRALILGLAGYDADTVEPQEIPTILQKINDLQTIALPKTSINFVEARDIVKHFNETLPEHSNGMLFKAFDNNDNLIHSEIYYSTGGGFIVKASDGKVNAKILTDKRIPYPFETAADLLAHCHKSQLSIDQIVYANELAWRSKEEIDAQCIKIWQVMDQAIDRGCHTRGILPGGLKVPRRAADLFAKLKDQAVDTSFLNMYAMAVNEENAAGNRVVTAPTNGAAGIVPAVLKYYQNFYQDNSAASVIKFLLTAGAIGILYKKGASISGAEMGCQGEVGVASSMAAAAICALRGGSILQIEQAAEIAIEHNLGLTCDPIKGLVQIPCIERNAMGAVKAVNAATIAMLEEGKHIVSLDNAIKTMKATGRDMSSHYKETSQGGLAVNVPEC